jgi:hypothetical protein
MSEGELSVIVRIGASMMGHANSARSSTIARLDARKHRIDVIRDAAEGAIADATGQEFDWSAGGFAVSVGMGGLMGGATSGIAYGIGKYSPKIFGWMGQRVGKDPAKSWTRWYGGRKGGLDRHVDIHAHGRSVARYTDDALVARNAKWGNSNVRQGFTDTYGPGAKIPIIGGFVKRIFGSVGWQISGKGGGVYTLTGKIVTFWG